MIALPAKKQPKSKAQEEQTDSHSAITNGRPNNKKLEHNVKLQACTPGNTTRRPY